MKRRPQVILTADAFETEHGKCPACGASIHRCPSINTGYTKDDLPIQQRRCKDCGHRFTTAVVTIPASFFRINQHRKDWQGIHRRQKNGWRYGSRTRAYPSSPTVKIVVGVREDPPAVRLAPPAEAAA